MAVKLGRTNVNAMLRNLTAKQFREWEQYAELEPFDETRQDYRIASVVATLANLYRGKNQKALTLDDCVVRFGKQAKRKQTVEEQIAIAYAMVAAYSQPVVAQDN
jgi:hypothetical protein